MNKNEIIQLLKRNQVCFEHIEHPPIFTVEEGDAYNLPNRNKVVRNLFIRDSKKKNYFIITLYVHKTIDLKKLKDILGTTRLSFANPETMQRWLGVQPGSVTPLAILNDTEHNVQLILDADLQNNLVGCHPLKNDATLFFQFQDLYNFLSKYRSDIKILQL